MLAFLFLVPFTIAGCYLLFTLMGIQLIIFGIKVLRNRKSQTQPVLSFPALPKYYRYFLFYILATLVSTLFSIDRMHSLKDNKEIFIYLLVPLVLVVLNSKKRLEYSLAAVLAAAVGSSLWGYIQVLIRGIDLDNRPTGGTSHWMTYSGLLMMPFIFFFIYLFYEKRKQHRIAIIIALVSMLPAIFLSQTRSIWVGIIAALGLFFIYYKPKILYLAIPALLILVLVLPGSIKARVVSTFDLQDATNKDRLYMIQIAFDIFKDYPITGAGPNSIEKIYDRYKPAGAKKNLHLHNNFLHVLAERGLLGALALLAAFVSVLFYIIGIIRRRCRSVLDEKIYATCVLFVFIGFLVAGLFEYNFGDTEVKFLLLYFITLPFLSIFSPTPPSTPSATSAPSAVNPPNGEPS
jgi:O-antigen ligase